MILSGIRVAVQGISGTSDMPEAAISNPDLPHYQAHRKLVNRNRTWYTEWALSLTLIDRGDLGDLLHVKNC